MIKWVCFDLDDTLFNGTLLVKKAREASVEMMIEFGLPVERNYTIKVLNEIVHEFGSNDESHLDNLITRLRNDPDVKLPTSYNIHKYVAAGIMGYHREKVKHFRPFRDVVKTLTKLKTKNIKTALITDGSPKKQYEKLLRLKIEGLFDEIIISDEIAIRKPNPIMFSTFLRNHNLLPHEVIYIGDRLDKDVVPSKQVGIISVLIHRGTKYDPHVLKKKSKIHPDYHLNNLYDIFSIIETENKKIPLVSNNVE